jgi:alpha-maltose-1-phosphate synthase
LPEIILAHAGRQHSYFVAKNLQQLDLLQRFYTSSYVTNAGLQKYFTRRDIHFFAKRYLDGLSGKIIHANWWYEVPEFLARLFKMGASKVSNLVFKRDAKFDEDLSKKLKRLQFDIFWGFQGSSLLSLGAANSLGKQSIVEMTMAYIPFAKKLLTEESKLHPEWSDSIDIISFPSSYEERLIKEPQVASKVFAVSAFLKQTLVEGGIEAGKVEVIPLGFDISGIPFVTETPGITGRPLKLLYVGRITQGKGIKYMLDAMKQFKKEDVELHIIGNVIGKGKAFSAEKDYYTYHGAMPQKQLFAAYTNFDALLFPSLMEGFPLAVIEAMGAGLPVITTPNTSAEELITDGDNGFIVPIRDTNAIVKAIAKLRMTDNTSFQKMRQAARNKALEYTWDAHRLRVKALFATQ